MRARNDGQYNMEKYNNNCISCIFVIIVIQERKISLYYVCRNITGSLLTGLFLAYAIMLNFDLLKTSTFDVIII